MNEGDSAGCFSFLPKDGFGVGRLTWEGEVLSGHVV